MRATQVNNFLSLVSFSFFSFSNAAAVAKRGPPPAAIAGGWTYQGCYVDVGRTIAAADLIDPGMTNEMCAAFCQSKGLVYFGTEWYQECYCGNVLAPGGVLANEADCSTSCNGDPTQPCGGANRLTLYWTNQGPKINPGVNGFGYQGCLAEGTTGRALDYQIHTIEASEMTVAKCTLACKDLDFVLAGVEYSGECYCGNTIANGGAIAIDSDCDMLCNGNVTEYCGGPNRLSFYDLTKGSIIQPGSSTSSSASSTVVPTSTSMAASTSSIATSTTTSTVPTSTSTIASTTTSPASSSTSAIASSTSSTALPTGPVQPVTIGGWTFLHCYTEADDNVRALNAAQWADDGMTLEACAAFCAGYTYFGTEWSRECFCGNTFQPGSVPAPNGDCNMVCAANPFQYCGAGLRLSVYTVGAVPSSSSSSSSSATSSIPTSVTSAGTSTSSTTSSAVPTGPVQPAAIGDWNFLHCYTEADDNVRALNAAQWADDGMTLEACATFCAGYDYFGTEWSRECFCGNSFQLGSVQAPNSECNMVCAANPFQYCGAGLRLSVYTIHGVSSSSSSLPVSSTSSASTSSTSLTVTTSSSIATSSTISSTTSIGSTTSITSTTSISSTISSTTSSTSAPIGTGFPAGWTAQGCWVDQLYGRILGVQLPDDPTLTQEKCARACYDEGYTISGTQYYYQCFCGEYIINSGALAADQSQCNTPCVGNEAQMCGGPDRMTIYSQGTPEVHGPPAPQTGGLGGWVYAGCVNDNIPNPGKDEAGNDLPNNRTFFWRSEMLKMTPKQCLDRCAEYGYAAAGLEYGIECWCGDEANIAVQGAEFRPESECTRFCPGNSSTICGDNNRLTTYVWKGDPLYEWDFPQTPATAGSYTFLIGGVCVPLITMQSVTGKVTFLEKWMTGPENSTGAYELDLSQIDNFEQAWKTMHVDTDIFCSAGITLPDKAGRQLTIGGWSGDSTYGVRLYTPDGSDGVKGPNDWEENVGILRLQDGRWYPSAMVMANGSILILSGEEGSNGAMIPTLEILPYTGTAPLYMEWLDRTWPNNLYPFTAVLPGGGIFVAYWNEARILDEATFATSRVLPNIPGAVNDDLGGRTYPLEGTAVLLPQVYPYTEDLEVLICGGSTIGPGWALDNCVTIAPEAPAAEWQIERMPSRRVMPCIAPLPDGTYLIANGAQQGVAGFGLATNPNLNAVLYDPSKPLGSRMTVMANTTVARLYHSEAITLLDGRVLISGSDPEDGKNPQEYRIEVFNPPYLLSGKTRPTFTVASTDWAYGQTVTFTLGHAPVNGVISATLLGSVSSTHGNSMGARTIMPLVEHVAGLTYTITAPPDAHKSPPGWFQLFILDGGIPAVGVFVRIGGDPAGLGNWPQAPGFTTPGM